MQATVLTFDGDARSGTVVTDEGRCVAFGAEAFTAGGLRLLRPGQRIRANVSPDGEITAVTVVTLVDPLAASD